jgi:hypothetical protein
MHQHPQRHPKRGTTTAGTIILATVLLVATAGALVAGPLGQMAGAMESVTLYAAPGAEASTGCTSQRTAVCTIQGAIGAAESSTYDGDDVTVVLEHSDGSACSSTDTCTFELPIGEILTDTNTGRLTIKGNSPTDTILQGSDTSVIDDHTGTTTPVVISDLEITGGSGYESGGGIRDDATGSLTITDAAISGNTADYIAGGTVSESSGGGIYDDVGALTISDSRISDNTAAGVGSGGGIYDHSGTVTITDSTISGNSSLAPTGAVGGGIADDSGTMTIIDSAISENEAASGDAGAVGGGVYDHSGALTIIDSAIAANEAASGEGGGIYDDASAVTVIDSTVSGNSADGGDGGGIYGASGDAVSVIDSTVSGNSAFHGGGIDSAGGSMTVAGSIVADNAAPTTTVNNCEGVITDAGYDLSDGSSCGFAASDHSADDAMLDLGTLGSNGGPTPTVPLLTTHADQAIGFIPSAATATLGSTTISLCGDSTTSVQNGYGGADLSLDQRGDPRLPDGATSCDAGAYELQPLAQMITFTSSAPTDATVGGPSYAVTATGGGSGNAVVFSSATPAVCTVTGSAVSFVGAGTCTIDANQAGNADYAAAAQVTQSFAVASPSPPGPFTPAPTLGAISPSSGPVGGGTVVTVSGTGLCDPTEVAFGSVPGTEVSVNASCTTVTVTSPAEAAGGVAVTVTTAGGTSNAESFTYVASSPVVKALASPTLTAMSPTSGSLGGGETVTVVGTNLCGVTSVDFGATPGMDVSVNGSCTTLSVVDPAGLGTVAVVVSTASGSVTAPVSFTYVAPGYWLASADGSVYSFGGARFFGSLPSIGVTPNAPIVAMADTPDHGGYWLFAADGGVFAFGDAQFYGSVPGVLGQEHRTLNQPIVAAEAMPNGEGYRLFAADGGVFDFGDAGFVGSLPCSAPGSPGGLCIIPNRPITSAVSDPLGEGYWLMGGDGGVFALGDAPFYGSLGAQSIASSIVAMAATSDGGGYWVYGANGSVTTSGDAVSYGSMLGSIPADAPIVFGASTTSDHGYWLFGRNGGVYAFGSAPFDGSLPGIQVTPTSPIVTGVGF